MVALIGELVDRVRLETPMVKPDEIRRKTVLTASTIDKAVARRGDVSAVGIRCAPAG